MKHEDLIKKMTVEQKASMMSGKTENKVVIQTSWD